MQEVGLHTGCVFFNVHDEISSGAVEKGKEFSLRVQIGELPSRGVRKRWLGLPWRLSG